MHLTLQQVQFRPNVASSSKHLTKNIKHFDYHYCSLSRLNLNIMQLFNCYLLLLSLDFHKVLRTMYKTMKNSELNHILKKISSLKLNIQQTGEVAMKVTTYGNYYVILLSHY